MGGDAGQTSARSSGATDGSKRRVPSVDGSQLPGSVLEAARNASLLAMLCCAVGVIVRAVGNADVRMSPCTGEATTAGETEGGKTATTAMPGCSMRRRV